MTKIAYKSKVFDIIKLDNGYEIVDHPGAVVILPIFKNTTRYSEILMLNHWRPAINSYILELPAGTLDVKKETPIDCAKRELVEETGYTGTFNSLGSIYPSPGYTNEIIYMFYATDLIKVALPHGSDMSDIDLQTKNIYWDTEWTTSFIDAKTIAAMTYYQNVVRGNG